MTGEELRDFQPAHVALRKRRVDPKYQEAYDRINRITPDRPNNHVFETMFQQACDDIDAAERTIGGPMYKPIDHFEIVRDENGIERAVAVRSAESLPRQSLRQRLKNLFFYQHP